MGRSAQVFDPSVTVIGNLTVDDIVLAQGEARMATPGGNGLYAAVAALLSVDSVGLIARAGKDYPTTVLNSLVQTGVRSEGIHRSEKVALRTWILYEDTDTRRYFSRHPDAAGVQLVTEENFRRYMDIVQRHQLDMTPAAGDIPAVFLDSHAFHIAPMVEPRQRELVRSLVEQTDASLLLDPHFDLMARADKPSLAELLVHVDVFLPSEEDLSALDPDCDLDTLKELTEFGPGTIVLKRGSRGSVLYDRSQDRLYRIPAYPASVADPTGAGDAYCGAFAAALARGLNSLEAAVHGTVAASLVIEDFGAMHVLEKRPHEFTQRRDWILARTE